MAKLHRDLFNILLDNNQVINALALVNYHFLASKTLIHLHDTLAIPHLQFLRV